MVIGERLFQHIHVVRLGEIHRHHAAGMRSELSAAEYSLARGWNDFFGGGPLHQSQLRLETQIFI